MGSSLETADTGLGTGCRISHIVTQMNYCVLALCYNMQTELSHFGRGIYHGQVFPHPCVKHSSECRQRAWCVLWCRCLPARTVRGQRGGRAGVPGMPELLGKLIAESKFPVCCCPEKAATCLPFPEPLPRCSGNVSIALRNTFSCFCVPAAPNSPCKLCKHLHSLLE